MIPPFDHPDVIAGQGTIGLEILEQRPDVAHDPRPGERRRAASPASRSRWPRWRPTVRVIGVEPAGAAKLTAALAAGAPTTLERTESMADGLLSRSRRRPLPSPSAPASRARGGHR